MGPVVSATLVLKPYPRLLSPPKQKRTLKTEVDPEPPRASAVMTRVTCTGILKNDASGLRSPDLAIVLVLGFGAES